MYGYLYFISTTHKEMNLFQVLANARVNQMGCFGRKNAHGNYTMFTCAYGNVNKLEGNRVYEIGGACEKCPGGTECKKEKGLCGKYLLSLQLTLLFS